MTIYHHLIGPRKFVSTFSISCPSEYNPIEILFFRLSKSSFFSSIKNAPSVISLPFAVGTSPTNFRRPFSSSNRISSVRCVAQRTVFSPGMEPIMAAPSRLSRLWKPCREQKKRGVLEKKSPSRGVLNTIRFAFGSVRFRFFGRVT